MKLVVLDGFTLNPGDLSWDALCKLADCRIYDRTAPEQVLERASGAELILVNKVVLSRELLEQLPGLRYIGVLATGYNVVDVSAASELGIVVTNVPVYGTASVAQMVFAHLLHLTCRVAEHAAGVSSGQWSRSRDFCYWNWPLTELQGLTLGIVGYGRIGQQVARIAEAFGMEVAVHSRRQVDGVRRLGLDELFRVSDAITLHCPLTPETERMVNQDRLASMKPGAFLVNTGRGGLIDEEALADALNNGRIAGAGLDVLSKEPPEPENPLLSARNCFITPHIAWATFAARKRLLDTAVGNVRCFLENAPRNTVK